MTDTSDSQPLSMAQTILMLAKAVSLNTAAMQAMTESNLILASEIAQANAPEDEMQDDEGHGATDMAGRRVNGGRN